jgi:D-glycero-alpha-D-manno-heptose-7-phosphate kinase
MRITLGGGGTDLPSYYSKYGGFLIAGAIDKYCNITAHKRFYDSIRLSYSETEIVNNISEIKHRIFRTALELVGINHSIELFSAADVPSGCGLGSSSSFTVALLHALHVYNKEYPTQKYLAEEACRIEIDLMKEPIGKQDQYIAAFGGLTCLTFEKDGTVIIEPLSISDDNIDELEGRLLLFFTGKERSASDILREQDNKSKQEDHSMIDNLHQIKEIGFQTKKYLESGNPVYCFTKRFVNSTGIRHRPCLFSFYYFSCGERQWHRRCFRIYALCRCGCRPRLPFHLFASVPSRTMTVPC